MNFSYAKCYKWLAWCLLFLYFLILWIGVLDRIGAILIWLGVLCFFSAGVVVVFFWDKNYLVDVSAEKNRVYLRFAQVFYGPVPVWADMIGFLTGGNSRVESYEKIRAGDFLLQHMKDQWFYKFAGSLSLWGVFYYLERSGEVPFAKFLFLSPAAILPLSEIVAALCLIFKNKRL